MNTFCEINLHMTLRGGPSVFTKIKRLKRQEKTLNESPRFVLYRNMQRFRGGLVSKARRLCVSFKSKLGSDQEEEEDISGACLRVHGNQTYEKIGKVTE